MSWHLRARFTCVCADEKALKESFCTKEASGIKCCIDCENCVNSAATGDEFKQRGPETYIAIHDMLEAAALSGLPPPLEQIQKRCGLTYDDGAILADSSFRSIAKVPYVAHYDWMHNLFASGGVLQHQCTLFVLQLTGRLPSSKISMNLPSM